LAVATPRPFLKQKVLLYFDENFPGAVISQFASASRWKKKFKVTGASECSTLGQPDSSHYTFCQKHKYTLVALDRDFDNDQQYPFTFGMMPGIIMIRASSSEVDQIIDILTRVLTFLIWMPLPRAFLRQSLLLDEIKY